MHSSGLTKRVARTDCFWGLARWPRPRWPVSGSLKWDGAGVRRRTAILAMVPLAFLGIACEGDTTVTMPADPEIPTAPEVSGITVSGVGEARGTPDVLYLNLSVDANALTVAEARSEGAAAAELLVASLRTNNIAEADIKTTHIGLNPVYEYPQNAAPRLIGYQYTNGLMVTVRQVASAGKLIDDALAAGGDSARMNGLQFGFDKPEALLAEARQKAMADAVARAGIYANGAGVSVGPVEYISEFTGGSVYPRPPATGGGASLFETTGGSPVQPGQSSVSVNITVRFGIDAK